MQRCLKHFDSQVEAVRGVSIAKGLIPIGPLLDHRCTAIAEGLPARDVLASLLEQVGRFPSYMSSPARYSWALLFDINTGKYFLSTPLVEPNPDSTPVLVKRLTTPRLHPWTRKQGALAPQSLPKVSDVAFSLVSRRASSLVTDGLARLSKLLSLAR